MTVQVLPERICHSHLDSYLSSQNRERRSRNTKNHIKKRRRRFFRMTIFWYTLRGSSLEANLSAHSQNIIMIRRKQFMHPQLWMDLEDLETAAFWFHHH